MTVVFVTVCNVIVVFEGAKHVRRNGHAL